MKGDKLNAFMLFRCFCFLRPGGTYNNFFMAPSASWQSGEGAGRSERCHHLKRSLKVYTFLWGWEDRAKERSDDEIGEISFWFIIKTKDFHQHHRDLECIFLLSLREKKFLFFCWRRRKYKGEYKTMTTELHKLCHLEGASMKWRRAKVD